MRKRPRRDNLRRSQRMKTGAETENRLPESPDRIPHPSLEQWVAAWCGDPRLDAESRVVLEVIARHAYAHPDGGFAFTDTDEFYADAGRALEYWRSWGRASGGR